MRSRTRWFWIALCAAMVLVLGGIGVRRYRSIPDIPLQATYRPCNCDELSLSTKDAIDIAASQRAYVLKVQCFAVDNIRNLDVKYDDRLQSEGWLPFYVSEYKVRDWVVSPHSKGRDIVFFAGRGERSEGSSLQFALIYGVRSPLEYIESKL